MGLCVPNPLLCDDVVSPVLFEIIPHRTNVHTYTAGPVIFILNIYMMLRTGNFIITKEVIFFLFKAMNRTSFQTFFTVNA